MQFFNLPDYLRLELQNVSAVYINAAAEIRKAM